MSLKLVPGQKLQAIMYENPPQRPMKRMRGFLKGVATDVPRGNDRA